MSVGQGDLLLGEVLDMDVDQQQGQQDQDASHRQHEGKAEEQVQSPG